MSNDPYNKSGFNVFMFCMVFTALFFIYIAFIHPGVESIDKNISKDYNPALEVTKFDLASVEKPWVTSEDMIKAGLKSYSANCASCHAADYKGMAAMGSRNLVEGKWKKGGTSVALFKTLQNGLEQDPSVPAIMASFKHLPVNERWALVHFVRSISENKIEDNQEQLQQFAQSSEAK